MNFTNGMLRKIVPADKLVEVAGTDGYLLELIFTVTIVTLLSSSTIGVQYTFISSLLLTEFASGDFIHMLATNGGVQSLIKPLGDNCDERPARSTPRTVA